MEEELSEYEIEHLRRLSVLQRTAAAILMKWRRLLVTVFILTGAVFVMYLALHTARSVHRFDADTRLLFTPRTTPGIESVSDRQLMSIIDRKSLKRKVGERVDMPQKERECLTLDMEVKQGNKQTNLFSLKARSSSWVGAVKKVNAYAEILIDEYEQYRLQDLENWRESFVIRRAELADKLAKVEAEQSLVRGNGGTSAPVEALAAVNQIISDQRMRLSAMKLQMGNEKMKVKKLEKLMGANGAAMTANTAAIRKRNEEIASVDRELAALRELYTDINPKVIGKLEERAELVKSFSKFLEQHGIEGLDLDDLDKLDRTAESLSESRARLEVYEENALTLEAQIDANEKRAGELAVQIPAWDRLKLQRADIDTSMREIDDQLGRIAYLKTVIRSELRQIERAGGAGDAEGPLSVKTFIYAFVGTLFATFGVAFWILALELMFGKVCGGREIKAHDDIYFAGSVPKPGVMGEEEANEATGIVVLKLIGADVPNKIVFVCRLPGTTIPPNFIESLEFSATMSGKSVYLIDVVPASSFEPPEGAETMISVVRGDRMGWFPVANRFALAPTELQMLNADLETLKSKYDMIFIRTPDGVRRGGSFFDQMLGVCDCAMLEIGHYTTPRGWFSYVASHVRKAAKPMIAFVTGAPAKTVRREMENVK